ncbi:SDR family NAD(P)-dependent oxidoreductase [Porticoccus sp.]|uniref:SDR family NAD(P)-dependent oxidoreductase n=1 Tax=Porticoccus sp. TaxID=2024853 RepID=UPI000C10D3AA|nr:MAG: 3-oxoacyl-ACP reductase [Porticoccus sp.]
MKKLAGKVALVTGAGRGIGREIALKLASEGARLVINDLDAEPLEKLVSDIQRLGSEAVVCPGSVTAEDFGVRFVKAAVDAFDDLDIIINNAGYTWDNVIQKIDDEQWYAMLDVHMTAPYRILKAAQPFIKAYHTLEVEGGDQVHRKIVNVSSISGLGGNAGQLAYSAAKAGVVGMTKTLCKEWGRYNVNVNAVAFGFIETRLTSPTSENPTINIAGKDIRVGVSEQMTSLLKTLVPLGRTGTAKEAADAVYLLCLPESNYISGQTLVVGGGLEI